MSQSTEYLIEKIKKSMSLSAAAELHLKTLVVERRVGKGEVLIHQGQAVRKTYLVF
ncbi:MAG: hypothetical protein ACPHXR_02765 [Flavicella sp.]